MSAYARLARPGDGTDCACRSLSAGLHVRVELSQHARLRLEQHGVSVAEITTVVEQPDIRVVRKDGRWEFVGKAGARRVKVVIAMDGPTPVVVTVHPMDRLGWRRKVRIMALELRHDPQVDAAYVFVAPRGTRVAHTKELDENRNVDFDVNGDIVGIEFLGVSRGVDLSELPYRPELEHLFEEHHFPVFA